MSIAIQKADSSFLRDCTRILWNSDLGRVYFGEQENVEESLAEGLTTEEVYAAVDGGQTLGFYWYTNHGAFHSFPYLHIIAVDEACRGRGVGTALLAHFEALVFEKSSKAFLVVADFNTRAKKLYESIGYEQVGAIDGLYKKGITEFLMMKRRPDTTAG